MILHHAHGFQAQMKVQYTFVCPARRAGSDGSMSASGPAGPGFDPWRGCKFSFENFKPRG